MDFHINNILNDLEKEGYDGYLLADFSNIQYLSSYRPTSFAFAIIKDEPIIYASKMDMEIANKNSTIEVKEFASYSSMINDLKSSIKSLAIEPSLEFSIYEKFREDFKISSVNFINKQRAIKTLDEIYKIEEATEIAQQAFRQTDFDNRTERIVAFELDKNMIENGASEPSFETIVTSGANSSLPHAEPTPNKLQKPILVDWGAKYKGYCSDNTRTMVYTEKQHEIFAIVAEAHDKAIHNIRPGMRCCEVDKIARDIISEYGYGDNFIHSTGHSLGLDIHESPGFSPKDETVIGKGMVMTVEPGIYIEGEFGVRLEDTVAIDDTARILGSLPLSIN